MANGRFVSRTIATDKNLSQLSLESEFLFLKTIPHLDRDGLILADVLWATVAPRRLTLAGIADDLWQEWVSQRLAIAYETKEGTILYFPGFMKNQQGMRYDREAPSRYEPPPGYVRTDAGLIPDTSPDELRTDSGPNPLQVEVQVQGQVEVKGEVEGQGQGVPAPANESTASGKKYARKLADLNGQVPATTRIPIVERLLDIYGYRPLVEAGDDATLYACHEQAVKFYRMGYHTGEAIDTLAALWKEKDWRGKKGDRPRNGQFEEFASQNASAIKPARQPEKRTVTDPITGKQYEVTA